MVTGSVPAEERSVRGAARLWIIGDHFMTVIPAPIVTDQSFSFPISHIIKENLTSQRYDLIIQLPATSDRFDINYNITLRTVVNTDSGTVLLTAADLQIMNRSDYVMALKDKYGEPEISDRVFGKKLGIYDDPWIRIDPVSNQSIGAVFTITGTTNLPLNEEIQVSIAPSSIHCSKTSCSDR